MQNYVVQSNKEPNFIFYNVFGLPIVWNKIIIINFNYLFSTMLNIFWLTQNNETKNNYGILYGHHNCIDLRMVLTIYKLHYA